MENWHEHIDDYINGTLEGDLLQDFEKELKINSSLKVAVDNYEDARKISEGLLEIDMMETLSKLKMESGKLKIHHIDTNNQKDTESGFWNLSTLVSVAAMIGVILFVGWWLMKSDNSHLDKERILAEYNKPVNVDATKSIDTVGMTLFEKGMHYYNLNRFEESEKWLKIYLSKETDKKMRSKGHFWLGAAHLEQWEVDEAREAWGKSEEEEAKENLELLQIE